MCAQPLQTSQLMNGRPNDAEQHRADESRLTGDVQGESGVVTDVDRQQVEAVDGEDLQSGLWIQEAGTEQVTTETTAGAVQASPMMGATTTLDLGRRSAADQSGPATLADDTSGEFATPRAMVSPGAPNQAAWLNGVEPPRWLQRLSTFLSAKGNTIGAYSTFLVECVLRYHMVQVLFKVTTEEVDLYQKGYFVHGGDRDLGTQVHLREQRKMVQDWLEVSYVAMCDISEGSAAWWSGVMEMVEEVYARWLTASPLEKLSIEPRDSDKWCNGKWTRVNARASSMLLTAMPLELRSEMVSRRFTNDCVKLMFRLFTAYQPGGSAERYDVLRRLQAPSDFTGGDSLEQVLRTVRSRPRWLERCKAVQMIPPDASVLSRGLLALTTKHIESSTDASFRTSMLRASLRLDGRPTLEQVQAYQRHLQAELEVMSLSTTKPTINPAAKVQAVETTLQPKAKDAGQRSTSGDLCRYFAKASGCRRGDKCNYSHSMASLDKELRAKKCLKCGAESHRQKDCPVGRPPPKAPTSQQGRDPKDGKGLRGRGEQNPGSTQGTTATVAAASALGDPVSGTPWTLEALVQAAQQVVQVQAEPQGESSPEKIRPEVKKIVLKDIKVCSAKGSATALVDSGATHSLRTAKSMEEWSGAELITVQLAGSHFLTMRITKAGTLLMPPSKDNGGTTQKPGQTIVPMGQLIQVLGYSMFWSPTECYLEDCNGHRTPLQTDGGCPQVCELEALTLIARLEDRKLEELKNATLTTKDKVQ
ncbi:unnamed protein product, partial [Symbiodinium sp. CCMP2456]